MSNNRRMVRAAVVVMLMAPAAVSAQQAASTGDQGVATLYGSKATLLKAAREQVKAARELPSSDPQAARGLSQAGDLFYHAGHNGDALRVLEESGDLALQRGDVAFAADVFLKAAMVATHAQQSDRAARLVARAELMSASPLLSADQRQAILDRIERRAGRAVVIR